MLNKKKLIKIIAILLGVTLLVFISYRYLIGSGLPDLQSSLIVGDSDPGLSLGNFKWLDDDRLIAVVQDHIEPRSNGGNRLFQKLVQWDTASNTTKVINPADVGGLCVLNGNIRYFTRYIGKDNVEIRQYHEGRDANFVEKNLREPIDLVTCEPRDDKSSLPEWARFISPINIIRLRPEHGFIWIDRDEVLQKPRGLWLFPSKASKEKGLNISKIMGDYPRKNAFGLTLKYFQHEHAYLTSAFGVDWWIYPNGKLISHPSRIMTTFDFSRKNASEDGPTRVGIIFGASNFTDQNVGNGGLFLRDFDSKVTRITSGRIADEIEISPNGCKVAYGNDRRNVLMNPTWLVYKLEIIDVCRGNK